MKLICVKPISYAGARRHKDQEFEARPGHVDLLVRMGVARRVPAVIAPTMTAKALEPQVDVDTGDDVSRPKRRYRRRDMTATEE